MRIILFTGKGGVGKTTVACATALLASDFGYRTLIMSTDSAHSLSDSFGIQLSATPMEIKKNLDGLEIDANKEVEKNWAEIQKQFSALLNFHGIDAVLADEMAIFPGMDELFSLVKLKEFYKKQNYDVVLVDCAPTGETLKLLSFPEIIRWYMRNIFPIQRNVAKVVRPLVKRVTNLPFPGDEFFEASRETYQNVGVVKEILCDESITSVRIVLNPEKMVIKEAQRSFTYLSLFDFPVDLIITNRIIPHEVKDPYFDKWKAAQKNYMKIIEETFSPLPVFSNTLFSEEITGLPLLKQVAETIYREKDPIRVFHKGKPVRIAKHDNEYTISLRIPFLKKQDLDILKKDEELIIMAGWYKRNILLPRSLAGLRVAGAKYEDEILRIRFRGEDDSQG